MAKKDEIFSDSILNGIPAPDLAALAHHFFAEAGGVQAVGKILHDEFMSAKAGSLARARILDVVLRITKAAQDKDGTDDLGMVSYADLKAKLKEFFQVEAKDGEPANIDAGPSIEGEGAFGGDVAAERRGVDSL